MTEIITVGNDTVKIINKIMKKVIYFLVFLVLFSACKKNSNITTTPLITQASGDTLSSSQLQILENAPLDTVTKFTDLLFPDGSNISKWDLANDSGYVYAFNRSTSILSAYDKKNLFIDRMSKAGLVLADDKQCACYLKQPNGLAYVYGSHSISTPSNYKDATCQ